ncbi:MAG TPA: response regulator [Casimicrobiaceae bacterium]|nr:response regulator [Casimicrobiaceae bacterium]
MEQSHPLRDFTVLVVEDNPGVLEATTYLIKAAFGCSVLTASSCVEALALIDEGSHVDLILSDVVLPGKDGLTLARMARERVPDLPVVLTTGWEDEIESIVERGYVALVKPYRVDQLEAVLTELLCTPVVARTPRRADGDDVDMALHPVHETRGKKPWHARHK